MKNKMNVNKNFLPDINVFYIIIYALFGPILFIVITNFVNDKNHLLNVKHILCVYLSLQLT